MFTPLYIINSDIDVHIIGESTGKTLHKYSLHRAILFYSNVVFRKMFDSFKESIESSIYITIPDHLLHGFNEYIKFIYNEIPEYAIYWKEIAEIGAIFLDKRIVSEVIRFLDRSTIDYDNKEVIFNSLIGFNWEDDVNLESYNALFTRLLNGGDKSNIYTLKSEAIALIFKELGSKVMANETFLYLLDFLYYSRDINTFVNIAIQLELSKSKLPSSLFPNIKLSEWLKKKKIPYSDELLDKYYFHFTPTASRNNSFCASLYAQEIVRNSKGIYRYFQCIKGFEIKIQANSTKESTKIYLKVRVYDFLRDIVYPSDSKLKLNFTETSNKEIKPVHILTFDIKGSSLELDFEWKSEISGPILLDFLATLNCK